MMPFQYLFNLSFLVIIDKSQIFLTNLPNNLPFILTLQFLIYSLSYIAQLNNFKILSIINLIYCISHFLLPILFSVFISNPQYLIPTYPIVILIFIFPFHFFPVPNSNFPFFIYIQLIPSYNFKFSLLFNPTSSIFLKYFHFFLSNLPLNFS